MKENEIRPKKIFNRYLKFVKDDIRKYFFNVELEYINCPACNETGEFSFEKENFFYYECSKCKTLYVNPRPKKKYFNNFYKDSFSSKYWSTTFYKETEVARRKQIWNPRAKLINSKLNNFMANDYVLIDIGGGYGTFCEEISSYLKNKPLMIEPSIYLSKVAREKNFKVIEKFLEDIESSDLPNKAKCFTSFELFEHLYNPKFFLEVLFNVMKKGDMFIFTTLSGMGVDIQVLGKKSKSVHPPHHLNFFNPKSVSLLLKEIGFVVEEITTPGKLDINILENNKKNIKDKFWLNFLEYSSNKEKENMQQFISDNLLSSHMMIVCRKV